MASVCVALAATARTVPRPRRSDEAELVRCASPDTGRLHTYASVGRSADPSRRLRSVPFADEGNAFGPSSSMKSDVVRVHGRFDLEARAARIFLMSGVRSSVRSARPAHVLRRDANDLISFRDTASRGVAGCRRTGTLGNTLGSNISIGTGCLYSRLESTIVDVCERIVQRSRSPQEPTEDLEFFVS
jgi:hypothetical protein